MLSLRFKASIRITRRAAGRAAAEVGGKSVGATTGDEAVGGGGESGEQGGGEERRGGEDSGDGEPWRTRVEAHLRASNNHSILPPQKAPAGEAATAPPDKHSCVAMPPGG